MPLTSDRKFDYILAGGGLQAGLLVLAIRHYQANARILVAERDTSFGGNHTWSFHRRDISPAVQGWLSSLPTHSWNSYLVRFPGYERMVDLEYSSTTSQMLAGVVNQRLVDDQGSGSRLLLDTEVSDISAGTITTGNGEQFRARCVIDCRGQRRHSLGNEDAGTPVCGYQKIYGTEIELDDDWPYSVPMLMDACVDQGDGFHFVYVLPFTRRRVLVEDTWFSNSPSVDFEASAKHLRSYIEKNTKSKWNTIRFERGCLPMPLRGLAPEPAPQLSSPTLLAGGYAGGWFHAATGYSFPLAAQFANSVATVAPEEAQQSIERLRQRNQFRFRFARFLNRLLFRLVKPESRWQIFRRLYRSVPQDTLSRFYAHEFSVADAVRMIAGVPPIGLTPFTFIRGMRDDRRNSRSLTLETSV
jgi:lycopene beta-cyclase